MLLQLYISGATLNNFNEYILDSDTEKDRRFETGSFIWFVDESKYWRAHLKSDWALVILRRVRRSGRRQCVAASGPECTALSLKQYKLASIAGYGQIYLLTGESSFINILIGALNHSHYAIRPLPLCGATIAGQMNSAVVSRIVPAGSRTGDLFAIDADPRLAAGAMLWYMNAIGDA